MMIFPKKLVSVLFEGWASSTPLINNARDLQRWPKSPPVMMSEWKNVLDVHDIKFLVSLKMFGFSVTVVMNGSVQNVQRLVLKLYQAHAYVYCSSYLIGFWMCVFLILLCSNASILSIDFVV